MSARWLAFALATLALGTLLPGQHKPKPGAAKGQTERFANGLPSDPEFFPIAVWLQAPHNVERYRDLGINLYVGLWDGPTEAQLAALEQAGMKVICAQNEVGLAHRGKAIVGWMHGDEPDNAQARDGGGYGPPVEPWQIVAGYEKLHKADPTRPVLLNLGQGAAWDGWFGRGTRTNHPEDYAEYLKGCDLASFDIYPVTHKHRDVRGRLEIVGRGVQRMRGWSQDRKPIWACIETGHVDNADARPTADQVRSEVWIAIASGASGIVYFAHEFAPKFVEAGLLEYPEIAAAIKATNAEVLAQAKVLNAPREDDAVALQNDDVAIAVRVHRVGDDLHVFAASLQANVGKPVFKIAKAPGKRVEVTGESRQLPIAKDQFTDDFAGYAFHHYVLSRN